MGKLADLMDGAVGYFWPDADDSRDALSGHVRLGPEGQLLVDVLSPLGKEVSPFMEPGQVPHSLMAATSVSGALFLDVTGVRHQNVFGGGRPNTRQYRCGAVVIDAPIHRLRSHNVQSLTAFFPGIGRWAGLSGAHESTVTKENGHLQSWTVRLESSDDLTENLPGGKRLSLSTHWEVDGPVDRRVLYAPVSLTVSSSRPTSWVNLIKPLMSIQGLVSLAYDGLVLADGGWAELDLSGDEEVVTAPTWWAARLMRQPLGVSLPKSMNEGPSFSLNTLGGMAGLRRWVALAVEYPRVVSPLLSPHRFGPINVETRVLELAAAMEYWVAVHRHTRAWAAKRPDSTVAHALALRIGKPFEAWAADPVKWAQRFWDRYNLLKHRPNDGYDPYELNLLAVGGTVLLQCALLNRAANSVLPARVICNSYRYHDAGVLTRELLEA